MKKLKKKVLQTIKKYNLINENDKIVIGVSGGPDSMCLLHLLNDLKNEYSKQVEKGKLSVKAMTESITDAKIDRLKSQDMLDSKEVADTIIEAAEKDIVSMAVLEGKEHIDEKAEEAKEKTEEAKEKAEEAKEEEAKEKAENNVTKAQEEIQKLMDINNMIDEDIKGIEIDIQH